MKKKKHKLKTKAKHKNLQYNKEHCKGSNFLFMIRFIENFLIIILVQAIQN